MTAMQALYGEEAGRAQALSDQLRAQTEAVMSNTFCLAFTRFCSERFIERNVVSFTDTPTTLHMDYKLWAEANWGAYLPVTLLCGEITHVQIARQGGKSSEFLPNSARGLSALLNKFKHELSEVCGINLSEVTKSNGVRVRTVTKTMLL